MNRGLIFLRTIDIAIISIKSDIKISKYCNIRELFYDMNTQHIKNDKLWLVSAYKRIHEFTMKIMSQKQITTLSLLFIVTSFRNKNFLYIFLLNR